MSRTTIETHSGLFYDYLDPKPEQVTIGDIAVALSNTTRFGGHSSRFYSVAEHSVLVRQLVIEAGRPDLGLAALLHDAHEAYIGDIPSPLKAAIGPGYTNIVADSDLAIAEAVAVKCGYDLDFHHPAVVRADALALRYEAAMLKESRGTGTHWGHDWPAFRANFVRCWDPPRAKREFLMAYERARYASS